MEADFHPPKNLYGKVWLKAHIFSLVNSSCTTAQLGSAFPQWSGIHCQPPLCSAAQAQPRFVSVRDVPWTQSTSRGRRRFTWRLKGAQWRCAGRCCREPGAGCSMRRPTAGSRPWSSANRGKHSGESAGVFLFLGLQKKTKENPDYCETVFMFAPSPGILMQIHLLLYCNLFFLQTSATHQTTESVH